MIWKARTEDHAMKNIYAALVRVLRTSVQHLARVCTVRVLRKSAVVSLRGELLVRDYHTRILVPCTVVLCSASRDASDDALLLST